MVLVTYLQLLVRCLRYRRLSSKLYDELSRWQRATRDELVAALDDEAQKKIARLQEDNAKLQKEATS